MARIISAPLGEMRGKLGGIVYSRNQYGMIARQHVQGVDPSTPAQLSARQLMAQAAGTFKTLDAQTRQGWAQWAETTWVPLGRKTGNGAVQAFTAAWMQAIRYAQLETTTLTTPQGAIAPTRGSSQPLTTPPCRMPIPAVTSQGQPNPISLLGITLTKPSPDLVEIDVEIVAANQWEGGQKLSYTDPELGDEKEMGIVVWQGAPMPHTGSPTGKQLYERTVVTSGIITSAINTTADSDPVHIVMQAAYIPTPTRDTDKPFLMPVEDVFVVRPITIGLYDNHGLATPLGTIILLDC